MTFAWQGFSIEHPEDWAPVTLNGSREEGYARLASSGKLSCQIRWKNHPRAHDLVGALRTYLAQLEAGAKKAKETFHMSHENAEESVSYKWSGTGHGRGLIFFSQPCSRVFFLEVTGARKDALLPPFRRVTSSFRSQHGELEPWSLLGLSVSLPHGLKMEKSNLVSGRTELHFSGKGAKLYASRWGFAQQLLAKHSLSNWATACYGMAGAKVEEESCGIRLTKSGLRPEQAIVTVQTELNQIVGVKVSGRGERWRPSWDWLT